KTPSIDFLLEQLRGIDLSICNERYSRLCLRGIRLNRYQVETLEEVFRRVHFHEIDLEDTFLDEPSATALFDMMLHYETCVDLSISLSLERSNSSIAWSRCVTYLRKSGALQRFKLSHTPLTANLFNGLSLSGLSLQSLTFRDCSLTGLPLHYLLRLLRFLMTYTGNSSNTSSTNSKGYSGPNANRYPRPSYRGPLAPVPWALTLRLPQNRISATDAENLLLLVRHQLVMLPGPPTPILPADAKVDSEATSIPTNKPAGGSGYLEELDISHNNLRDNGVQILCAGLLQAYHLQHRRLEVALTAIAQSTNPDSNPVTITVDTANLPPRCALPRARGLQRLILADNGLGNNGGFNGAGRHLAAVLRCSTERLAPLLGGLTFLDLSDNPGLGDGGVIELCEGLVRNYTMKELYLRNVKMKFDGAFALSGYIGETKSLVTLDIRQNPIDVAGIMAITRTLKVNRSLHSLFFDTQNTNIPTSEENEMMQICLKELTEYLRRNRSIQLQPEPDCCQTVGDEGDTISPKIQKAVQRVPSLPMPDDISDRKNEEEEIKEILLDPPRPSGYVSPHGSANLEDVLLDMPTMVADSPFEIESIYPTEQLQYAVTEQSDLLTSENADISMNQPFDDQQLKMATEEILNKEISVGTSLVEETNIPVQQEEQDPVEEVPIKLENMDSALEESTLLKENPTDEITSGSLGVESSMKFETFSMEHNEPTVEIADRKHLKALAPSPAEADKSNVYHQGDFEPIILQARNTPIPFPVSDEKSSLQAAILDSNQQEIIESDDFKDTNEIFTGEVGQFEETNAPITMTMSEQQFVQPAESSPCYEISQPEEIILSEFNLKSAGRILAESQPETEVKISTNSESEIPKETSCLTSNPNMFNIIATSQEKPISEDLLKEAMQQCRGAEITSEMGDSPYDLVTSEDIIRRDAEVSGSEGFSLNSSGHSPSKSTTKGVTVAFDLEEHTEEELLAESYKNEETYWRDTELESERPEGTFVLKKEQSEISFLDPKEIGDVPETECNNFIEHFAEPKNESWNTPVIHYRGSEKTVKETELNRKESFEDTEGVLDNGTLNDQTLCENVNKLENTKGSLVADESQIEVRGEKVQEASDGFTFRASNVKMEGCNEEHELEVVNVISKVESRRNALESQDDRDEAALKPCDYFRRNLSSDKLVEFRSETAIYEEMNEKKPTLFQIFHSDEEEMDQLQARIEEMPPTDALTEGSKGSAIEPSLHSESNLADYSKNEAYWTDFDQPGLEKHVSDPFNLQLEQSKMGKLIMHDITEEEDVLDQQDSFVKPDSESQIRKPVEWETGVWGDEDKQGDLEVTRSIDQRDPQSDNLGITTTINQENDDEDPYAALNAPEFKSANGWEDKNWDTEQISHLSEVPSDSITVKPDTGVNLQNDNLKREDNELSQWLRKADDIKQETGESDRQESKQGAFKLLQISEIKGELEESSSINETYSVEMNGQRGFNHPMYGEELYDYSYPTTEHKTPPEIYPKYQNSESELTFMGQEDIQHDDLHFRAEFIVKKSKNPNASESVGTSENISNPKEADNWATEDWGEEESAHALGSRTRSKSQTKEITKTGVDVGESAYFGHDNVFQENFESLSSVYIQATSKEVELYQCETEKTDDQEKFTVAPIGIEQPASDLETAEINPIKGSSEMSNVKRLSGDTSQSDLMFRPVEGNKGVTGSLSDVRAVANVEALNEGAVEDWDMKMNASPPEDLNLRPVSDIREKLEYSVASEEILETENMMKSDIQSADLHSDKL
ncbi:unnamed protein product, partial [Hymenolepis diminuta]